nr:SLF4 protein [Citrus maxima]
MVREIRATSLGDLSDDMMTETLSRLPVKSLMRFKCVCKSWCDLVKDPNFIYRHLNRNDNMRLMIYCTYKNPDDRDPFDDLITYFSVFPDRTLTDLHLQDLEPIMKGIHIGPYDGIFCLLKSHTLINLWNVSLNEYRVVPECGPCLPCHTKTHYANVALGLDPVTNDFKLVLILTLWNDQRDSFHDFSHVAVYNFSTNSWRDLEGFEMRFDYMVDRIYNVYLNGFCYWVVCRPDYSKAILSFSMSDEVFQEMEGPSVPQTTTYYQSVKTPWTLGTYDDHLSLLYSDKFAHSFELWILRGGSWTKHLTFGPFIETYQPLGFWRKGEFLLESSDKRVVLYDSRYQEIRDLGITGLWFSVHILKESLITVKEYDM